MAARKRKTKPTRKRNKPAKVRTFSKREILRLARQWEADWLERAEEHEDRAAIARENAAHWRKVTAATARAEARRATKTNVAAPWFSVAGQTELRYRREERDAIRREAKSEDYQDVAIADLRDLQAHAPAAQVPGHPGKMQELDKWAREFWEAWGDDYDFDLHDAFDMAYGYLDTPF